MIRALVLAAALAFIGMGTAQAKDVYLVLAEPGGALSFFGHAALIVTDEGASPITGLIYTYGINTRNPTKFRAEKHLGFSYFQQMTIIENRSLLALKLKLSQLEAQKLEVKLEQDTSDPGKFARENSFNLFDTNCITYLLEQLNKVTTDERKINVQSDSAFWVSIFGGPWNFVENIRFRAPVPAIAALEEHPVAAERLKWIPRFDLRQAQVLQSRLLPTLEKLADCKSWQPKTRQVAKLTIAIALKEKNAQLLNSIRKLQLQSKVCEDEGKLNTDLWMAAHDVLPMTAQDLRLQLQVWKSEGGAK